MRTALKVSATIVGLFAAYVAYWMYQDSRAHTEASELCDAIVIGSHASEALERAKGANRRTLPNPDGFAFLFPGPIFNAYLCEVKVADGKIASKQVVAMED